MGIYNEYYKKYYMDVKESENPKEYKSANQYKLGVAASSSNSNGRGRAFPIFLNIFSSKFTLIFVVQTAVVVVLFLLIIGARLYPTSIAKEICEKGYEYIEVGIFKEDLLKNKDVIAAFNEVKALFNIDEREESYVMKNYSVPVDLNNISTVKMVEDKLVLSFKDEAYIRASFSGTVKEVQKEDSISILIDHGNGIEIKYMGLEESSINKGDKVEKGSILGGIINTKASNAIIEVYYMGSRLDPSKCFNLENI